MGVCAVLSVQSGVVIVFASLSGSHAAKPNNIKAEKSDAITHGFRKNSNIFICFHKYQPLLMASTIKHKHRFTRCKAKNEKELKDHSNRAGSAGSIMR